MGLAITVGCAEQSPGVQTKDAHKIHERKAAAGLLAPALRPAFLVGLSIWHGETCAIHDADTATMPEAVERNAGLQTVSQMLVDLIQDAQRESGAGLAIGAGIWTHRDFLLSGKFTTHESHHFEDSLTAGARWGLHLIQEAPKNHL